MIEYKIATRLRGINQNWKIAPCELPDDTDPPAIVFFVESNVVDSLREAGTVRMDVYAPTGDQALLMVSSLMVQFDGVDDEYQYVYQRREAQPSDFAMYTVEFIFAPKEVN